MSFARLHKKRKDFGGLVHFFEQPAAVVMCFVWMYLHFPCLIFAYYVCQLCFCLPVSLVGIITLSARETFTVSN